MNSKPNPRKLILLITGLLAVITIGTVATYWQPLVAWYKFQQEFETLPVNAQGLTEYKHRQTGIIFVKVPGGTFMMGSPEDEEGRDKNEGPQHEVILTPFLISKYEISQRQWQGVMDINPSHFIGENLPVEQVSWGDCEKFCNRSGFSLPTEAQWEYACRGGRSTPFAFGDTISTDNANFKENSPSIKLSMRIFREKTLPVDSFKPNLFGIHQMHGNVYEWCADNYRSDFYSSQNSIIINPVCTLPSDYYYVIRGGFWKSFRRNLRSSHRAFVGESWRGYDIGFRPVRNLE